MKLRSCRSDRSTTEPVDEDDDLANLSDSASADSSDEDFLTDMIEEVDDSEDSSAEVFDEHGNISDEDIGSSASKKRKVSLKNKKGAKVGGNNGGEVAQVDNMNIDYHEFPKPKISSKKKNNNKKKEDRPTLMWEVWEEEQERWIGEHMAKNIELDNQNEFISETADAPSDLVMPLLRYQKEWLAWGLKQEEFNSRGGILADEMGMGKTVQAISLVLAKRELKKAIGEPCGVSSSPCSSKALPGVKGTLVICPLVAVIQWVGEIERFTAKGSNKILVYHGAKRGKTVQQFSEYDFVITTYSTVEAEYRKNVMPPKQKCQWCGKLLYDHKMAIHLKYFCGPGAVRTFKQSKQRKKGTKYSIKVSGKKAKVEEDDESESKGHKRKVGRKKNVKLDKAGKNADIGSSSDNPPGGINIDSLLDKPILHSVKWDRIILDEAHYIKDRRCNTTRAILALESSYKWALSGTPLQNRVGELYSLVRFLQIVPYSYYFCKDCDCRTLDYSSSNDCPNCPHKAVRHFCWWNRYVATPIQNQGNSGRGQQAMFLLKHKLLKSIVLRRTKTGRAADLALPPRIVTLRKDTLDIKEEDYYTSLYNESQSQFNTYIEEGTVMNNYAHIFDLLTRLRQAVDHPYLVVYSTSAANRSGTVADDTNGSGEQACGLCHDPAEDQVVTSCTHIFCKSCLIDFAASMGQVSCPTCSKPLTVDFSSNVDSGAQSTKTTIKGFRSSSIINRVRLDDFQTSTKIEALREEIRFMVERDGSAKGIVFSQFTSFLDLIHYSLQKSGINCVQLVGSMSMKARDAAITRFTDDPDCKIFLMSLKAGGVALNLTVASHVFLMDPWWNPAVERQAQDRIHRIGQYKPIRIVRFIIENTIEERILKLQEKKELVFEGTVGGSSEALGKLTEADLKFLFVT